MLSIKIEKEIRNDQKIVFGLTARQVICVMSGVGIGALFFALTRADIFQLVPVFVLLAVIFGMFGWIEKDGQHMEDFLLRRMKTMVYRNNRLRYRTSNRYIRLLNKELVQSRKRKRTPERTTIVFHGKGYKK